MKTTIDRVSLISERFDRPKPCHVPTGRTILLYLLSIFALFQSAGYCRRMLEQPFNAFRLLQTESSLKRQSKFWNTLQDKKVPTCLKGDNDQSLFSKAVCLLPRNVPPSSSTTAKHHGNTFSSVSTGWITFPFLVKQLSGYLGFIHEIFLLPGGRTNPEDDKTWVFRRIRRTLLGWATVSSFFLTVSLTIDPLDHILLNVLLYASCFVFGGLSSFLFFGRDLERLSLAAVCALKILIILSRGAITGGMHLLSALVGEGLLEILAIFKSVDVVPSPLAGAMSNLFSTLSTLALYVAIVIFGTAKPNFPQEYADVMFPPNSILTVLVFGMVSGFLGFVTVMHVSPTTYQAFRTTCSAVVWSLLQFLMLSGSFVKNPYKLSDVYDRQNPPQRFDFRPFWQQHPTYLPTRLGIPSIDSDELPRTGEIFSSLKSILTFGRGLLSWLDYHFPQADPLASLKNKMRMRHWDDGTRLYPSFLFRLSPTIPNEAKTLQETPVPMINAFKEGTLLAYLCQYGIGNTFLRRAVETTNYPYYRIIDCDDNRVEGEGVVLDLRHLEEYETKPDYEPYGGIAYFRFELVHGYYDLVGKWVVAPKSQRKTLFSRHSGEFLRAEEMIVASLYFETAVRKHLGELHLTYNVLSTLLNNAFDYEMNRNFPNEEFKAHPFRLILYPHLYSHSIVVELAVIHLVQVGGAFTQFFALTQESLCNYLTTNFCRFHHAEDEQFEQRIKLNHLLLSNRHRPDAPTAAPTSVVAAVSKYNQTVETSESLHTTEAESMTDCDASNSEISTKDDLPNGEGGAAPNEDSTPEDVSEPEGEALLNQDNAEITSTGGDPRLSPETVKVEAMVGENPSDQAAAVTSTPHGRPASFNCCLDWELDYREIFHEYAKGMIDAIYGSDEEVAGDEYLGSFYQCLQEVFHHPMPSRYDNFTTKKGVTRFLSDTVFHLTVKHEFYGNSGFFAAVDPRINATQVPKDGGPPAVDEWLSLVFTLSGAAYPPFIGLLQDADNLDKVHYEREMDSIFDDATPITASGRDKYVHLRQTLKLEFSILQRRLRELDNQWRYRGKGKRAEGDDNYMYFRPLPADLATGPGF